MIRVQGTVCVTCKYRMRNYILRVERCLLRVKSCKFQKKEPKIISGQNVFRNHLVVYSSDLFVHHRTKRLPPYLNTWNLKRNGHKEGVSPAAAHLIIGEVGLRKLTLGA